MISCKKQDEKSSIYTSKYLYVNFSIECCDDVRVDTTYFDYSVKATDSLYYLFYSSILNTDRTRYTLSPNNTSNPYYSFEHKEEKFVFVSRKTIQIGINKYKVFKYALNPFSIDGCITHFWVPEIGIILKHSSTWKNFSKLQTDNHKINSKINQLTDIIFQDETFYKGCNREYELILKEDYDNYLNWKLSSMNSNKIEE